eukprot:5855835-Pleurochrysis_carterae.AAC.1
MSGSLGNAETQERAQVQQGAGVACAKGLVATAYERRTADLPPVPSYDCHVLHQHHVVNCRFSARGNLHRDLDLSARRSAVLAHAQPSGYSAMIAER